MVTVHEGRKGVEDALAFLVPGEVPLLLWLVLRRGRPGSRGNGGLEGRGDGGEREEEGGAGGE